MGCHIRLKKISGIKGVIWIIGLLFFIWCGLPAAAAEGSSLEYQIQLEGDPIGQTKIYPGPVTVVLEPADVTGNTSFWINQQNIWMLLSPEKEAGNYKIQFTADGEYDLQFKSENPVTLAKNKKEISFSISNKLNNTMKMISGLPDPAAADQKSLEDHAEQVKMAGNLVNELTEEQRTLIPKELNERLSALRTAMKTVPGWNDATPQPPVVELSCDGVSYENNYPSAVTISLKTSGTAEQLLMEEGGSWKEVQKGTDGKYTVQVAEQGQHTLKFCAAANGSHSTIVTSKFSIDPDVPAIISEIVRIRAELAVLPLHDYVTDLEKVYLKYMNLPPRRQALVPQETVEQMVSMYDYIIDFIGFHKTVQIDGRYVTAVGMYNSLGVGMKYLQRVPVEFHAERVAAPKITGMGTLLAGYRFSITPDALEGVPLTMNTEFPIRIGIQLPEDLKGKKNVDLYLLDNGKATAMNARVRSTEDNLVMYFNTTKLGEFVLVSQPQAGPDEGTGSDSEGD